MKFYLESISSTIVEDSYEEGEGLSTGCGLDHTPLDKEFNNIKEMLKYLKEWGVNIKANEIEGNETVFTRAVANHAEAQNGGWFTPTKDEIKKWKKGDLKLYAETYFIKFHKYKR